YQEGWPAVWKDADAIIFVYDTDERAQEQDLEFWYRSFAMPLSLRDQNCVVFAHHIKPWNGTEVKLKLGKAFQRINTFQTSIETSSDTIKREFDNLCQQAIIGALERRDKEEKRVFG
ncbi:MAG: hypothetical protein EZS28_052597, partial [Streblomastix strix]